MVTGMPTRIVYLCGPIAGLNYQDARLGWREEFWHLLEASHILLASPMRGKDHLEHPGIISGVSQVHAENPMSTDKGILMRDVSDLTMCHAVVANFLGATKASIGSVAELGMAHILRKPVVLVIEKEGNVHDHPFVVAIAGYRVETLKEAAWVVHHLLTPGL